MKKYYTRSDLAIESLAHAVKDKDYKHSEKKKEMLQLKHLKFCKQVNSIHMKLDNM